jgi:hypothetical protein
MADRTETAHGEFGKAAAHLKDALERPIGATGEMHPEFAATLASQAELKHAQRLAARSSQVARPAA